MTPDEKVFNLLNILRELETDLAGPDDLQQRVLYVVALDSLTQLALHLSRKRRL
jgi:hypothetical protein